MTTFKKILAMTIALPLALGSASALAFGGDGNGNHHGGYHGGKGGCGMKDGRKVFRELDLTDAQQQQMKEMRDANREAMRGRYGEQHAAMQASHEKMQSLVLAADFDENAVRELAQQMSEQQVERRVTMMKKRHEMLNILTPEQKK